MVFINFKMDVSIIIPTKNEESNLEEIFLRIKKSLENFCDYEIIIADSSKDKTRNAMNEYIKEICKEHKIKARLVDCNEKDLSNAIVHSLNYATYNIIAIMDGDLQHPPEMLPEMLKILEKENSDIVIGSRITKNFSLVRTVVSGVYRSLVYLFVKNSTKIRDPGSGFFAFRKKIVENVFLNPLGFKILVEILDKAHYEKVTEKSFIFEDRKRGASKFNLKQSYISFIHLFKIAKHNKEYEIFLKFSIVGAGGILVNMGCLYILTEFFKIFYLFSSAIAIELSIISNFILNDIWTFKNERNGNFFVRMGKFNLSRIFASVINVFILLTLTIIGTNYLLANLIGIFVATLFTYVTSVLWVWKR